MNLAEIEERAKKATIGPWDVSDTSELRVTWRPDHDHEFQDKNAPICHMRWVSGMGFTLVNEDADFIAHSREDIPALIAEVHRLEAENGKLTDAIIEIMQIIKLPYHKTNLTTEWIESVKPLILKEPL